MQYRNTLLMYAFVYLILLRDLTEADRSCLCFTHYTYWPGYAWEVWIYNEDYLSCSKLLAFFHLWQSCSPGR